MVAGVAPDADEAVRATLEAGGETAWAIGRIEAGARGCEVQGGAGSWGQARAWAAAHDG
jgi:phosphoribosylformylglycinamidine cyclo-ligase